jgi:RNA polymerase subunit RPABC4/transcription elongation factor Spt4
MEPRIFHGKLTPTDVVRALMARFNRNNLRTQQFGDGEKIALQIGTRQAARAGGSTALTVHIQKVGDGVAVQVGRQAWLGVAASLGATAISALRNPLSLLGRLDDIAQDIENLQLVDEVWQTVETVARAAGASFELSERLRRMACTYCRTANPVGEPSCIACGAPLGGVQPRTCLNCGFIVHSQEVLCPNCKKPL